MNSPDVQSKWDDDSRSAARCTAGQTSTGTGMRPPQPPGGARISNIGIINNLYTFNYCHTGNKCSYDFIDFLVIDICTLQILQSKQPSELSDHPLCDFARQALAFPPSNLQETIWTLPRSEIDCK